MKRTELLNYLKIVVELEKNIYTIDSVIDILKSKHSKLTYNAIKPTEPQKPYIEALKSTWKELISLLFSVALVFGSIALFVYAYIEDSTILSVFVAPFATLFALVILGEYLRDYITIRKKNKRINDKNTRELNIYNQEFKNYKLRLEKYESDRNSFLENSNIEKDIIDKNIFLLKKQREESYGRLRTVYSVGIIHPKYRNFIAVSSFYDYIDTERCYTLKASKNSNQTGAYNLFESEILAKQIITQLNQINTSLDQIKQNQYTLFSAISSTNKQVRTLIDNTDRIVDQLKEDSSKTEYLIQNSEITKYNTAQTAKELHYMNQIAYLTGKNDGAVFNSPPTYY